MSQSPTTLSKLLDDGVFLDVTHLAKRAGQPYPTFVSSVLWNSPEMACSEERLLVLLRCDEFAYAARSVSGGWPSGCVVKFESGQTEISLPYLVRGEPARCCRRYTFIAENKETSTLFLLEDIPWIEDTGRLGEWAVKHLGDSQSDGILTLREALEFGYILDVSAEGREFGIPCRSFISASYWSGFEVRNSKEILSELLYGAAGFCERDGYTVYGTKRCRFIPSMDADFKLDVSVTLEPDEELGLFLLLTSWGGDRELKIKRMAQSGCKFAM